MSMGGDEQIPRREKPRTSDDLCGSPAPICWIPPAFLHLPLPAGLGGPTGPAGSFIQPHLKQLRSRAWPPAVSINNLLSLAPCPSGDVIWRGPSDDVIGFPSLSPPSGWSERHPHPAFTEPSLRTLACLSSPLPVPTPPGIGYRLSTVWTN